jgi:hypothetical protein
MNWQKPTDSMTHFNDRRLIVGPQQSRYFVAQLNHQATCIMIVLNFASMGGSFTHKLAKD